MFGLWPIATKSASTGSSRFAPVFEVLARARRVTNSSPRTSSTAEFQTNSIFGFLSARSCMIFDARSSSRRWITVTLVAKRVRKSASSIAVSPPPTTAIALPRKSAPSQVAQADTPLFVQPLLGRRGRATSPTRRSR